jgi:hypothetical protein
VIIASSVNVNQQRGSASMFLDCYRLNLVYRRYFQACTYQYRRQYSDPCLWFYWMSNFQFFVCLCRDVGIGSHMACCCILSFSSVKCICETRRDAGSLPYRSLITLESLCLTIAVWFELTAFGRCNMPTLKSQSNSLRSSPTLPKR